MNAGGLERLHESGRKTDGHTVVDPEALTPPSHKLEQPRLRERPSIEIGEQPLSRLVIADMVARVHIAIADTMLQRNAPLPASTASGGARVGQGIAGVFTWH